MLTKKEIMEKLKKEPSKHWKVDLFKEKNFKRKKCSICGKFFWTLDVDREVCGEPACQNYTFIGNSPTKEELSYEETWEKIKKFFSKKNHAVLKRYPVICRWYPLHFTIAGIINFYRIGGKGLEFIFPENPSIMSQPCLRFSDIENVGKNGRSFTCFNMIQQSSLYSKKEGYWKDRCIELDFELLTKVFGIDPEEILFMEDAWLGPKAFGPSLEYFVRGLELGNAVFTEFELRNNKIQEMSEKVIDMGAGHERFTWLTQGTPTAYDSIFPSVLDKLKEKCELEVDRPFLEKYSKFSGILNVEENSSERPWKSIEKELNLSKGEIEEKIGKLEGLYSITDHSKALLFGLSDGGVPGSSGGGYNLRVILRRSLNLINKYNFPFDLFDVIKLHAYDLKSLYPELKKKLTKINEIINKEEEKYSKTKKQSKNKVKTLLESGKKIDEKTLIELYDSEGIAPEILKNEGKKRGLELEIPQDFYKKVTEKHLEEGGKNETSVLESLSKIESLPKTNKLYYQDQTQVEFKGKILKVIESEGPWVILDRTCFYPEGGGQLSDKGFFNKTKVEEVQEENGIILHKVDKMELKEGETVEGKINWERRKQLMQHHTSTHIINLACRNLLGDHVWQAGARKTQEKGTLDITHFEKLSTKKLREIEEKTNGIINQDYPLKFEELSKKEAEEKYGFRIYQGGIPKGNLRIISFNDDHEACGGLHCKTTGEVDEILVLNSEKVQDGIIRLSFVAGTARERVLNESEKIFNEIGKILEVREDGIRMEIEKMESEWKEKRKEVEDKLKLLAEKRKEKIEFNKVNGIEILVKKFYGGIEELKELSKKISMPNRVIFLFGIGNKEANVFASCGDEAIKKGIDIKAIGETVFEKIEGKGGGNLKLVQGKGKNKNIEEVIEQTKKEIKRGLNG